MISLIAPGPALLLWFHCFHVITGRNQFTKIEDAAKLWGGRGQQGGFDAADFFCELDLMEGFFSIKRGESAELGQEVARVTEVDGQPLSEFTWYPHVAFAYGNKNTARVCCI